MIQVETLRNYVADALTEDQLQMFRLADSAGCNGFEFTRVAQGDQNQNFTLEHIRARLLRTGKQVGSEYCVWADEWAINVIANKLGITMLIFDEQAKGNKFLVMPPIGISDSNLSSSSRKVMMLQRTRREHFNLIQFDGQGLVSLGSLPQTIRQNWFNPVR